MSMCTEMVRADAVDADASCTVDADVGYVVLLSDSAGDFTACSLLRSGIRSLSSWRIGVGRKNDDD